MQLSVSDACVYFYPRSPCGERHFTGYVCRLLEKHFYPRSPCGERRVGLVLAYNNCEISIHALLAESDGFGPAWLAPGAYFYPRSPCGERHWQDTRNYLMTYFYPRSPCGERLGISACMCITLHIFLSTLSLRRATVPQQENGQAATISIHALLAESDEYWVGGYGTANNFYPRSPCGERHYFCGPAL